MARSIQELEQLALYDGRFYMGTPKDWGPQQNHGVWVAGSEPSWKRKIGQVVGLMAESYGDYIRTTNNLTVNQASALEFSVVVRSNDPFPGAPASIYIGGVSVSGPLISIASSRRIACTWGTSLVSGNNVWRENVPFTVLVTRAPGNIGHLHINGIEVATGAVGSGIGTQFLYVGGAASNYTAQATIFACKYFNTHITSEEASLLYEHSRIQLQPGSPKRSGIMSVR
jgi:hypothetical protein